MIHGSSLVRTLTVYNRRAPADRYWSVGPSVINRKSGRINLARRSLKLAVDNSKTPAITKESSRWQEHDPVFFHKEQIHVGTRLIYFGRTHHGELWQVAAITTYRLNSRGRTISESVNDVLKLSDDVTLVRIGGEQSARKVSFGYISYTSIWRIA
jgi:hypothetical protein